MKPVYIMAFLMLILIGFTMACSNDSQSSSKGKETSILQQRPPVPKQETGGPRAVLLVNDLPADTIHSTLPVIVSCILDIPETIIQNRRIIVTPWISGPDGESSSDSWQLLSPDLKASAAAGSTQLHWELKWQPAVASYRIGIDTTPSLPNMRVREAHITILTGKAYDNDTSRVRRRKLALQGKWDILLPEIHTALEHFPNDLQLRISLVDALAGSGNFDKAYQDLISIIKQGQESFETSAEYDVPHLPYWCIEYLYHLQSLTMKSSAMNHKNPLVK